MRNPNIFRNVLMGVSLTTAVAAGNLVLNSCSADNDLPITAYPTDGTIGKVRMVNNQTFLEGCFMDDAHAPGTKEGDDAIGGRLTMRRLDASQIDMVYSRYGSSSFAGDQTSLQDARHPAVSDGSPIERKVTSEGVLCHLDLAPGLTLPDNFDNGLVEVTGTDTEHHVTAVRGPLNASTRAVNGELVTDVAAGQPPVVVRYVP